MKTRKVKKKRSTIQELVAINQLRDDCVAFTLRITKANLTILQHHDRMEDKGPVYSKENRM
jgi:hypothetical protein